MEWNMTDSTLPSTVSEAKDILLKNLDEAQLAAIRANDLADLIDHHFGIGGLIRNLFALHENPALLADAGKSHPDDASLVILQALWRQCWQQIDLSGSVAHELSAFC